MVALGFDLITDNGLLITSNYERSQNKGLITQTHFILVWKIYHRKEEKYTFNFRWN